MNLFDELSPQGHREHAVSFLSDAATRSGLGTTQERLLAAIVHALLALEGPVTNEAGQGAAPPVTEVDRLGLVRDLLRIVSNA